MATAVYYDEEECLALPIFIAELELLVAAGGGARGGRATAKLDGVQLLELLQKLSATIPHTHRAVLKQYQRQVESTLYGILVHGSVGGAVSGTVTRSARLDDTQRLKEQRYHTQWARSCCKGFRLPPSQA
jgi:hypothetical protein